jgi:hypothetical protein
MSDVEHDLRSRVEGFINQLRAIVARETLAAVDGMLKRGEVAPRATLIKKAPSPARPAPRQAIVPRALMPKIAAPARRPGEKRPAAELEQITHRLGAYIKANPGQGIEQIAKALETQTKELTLPIKKLLEAKRIGSKGHKRATRYFPRG